jgi:hypothetical protein
MSSLLTESPIAPPGLMHPWSIVLRRSFLMYQLNCSHLGAHWLAVRRCCSETFGWRLPLRRLCIAFGLSDAIDGAAAIERPHPDSRGRKAGLKIVPRLTRQLFLDAICSTNPCGGVPVAPGIATPVGRLRDAEEAPQVVRTRSRGASWSPALKRPARCVVPSRWTRP